jgi:hypothetical protein
LEIPDDVDLDQDSDVQIVGTKELGYNESRTLGVKKLKEYFYPPKVKCFLVFSSIFILLSRPLLLSSNHLFSTPFFLFHLILTF